MPSPYRLMLLSSAPAPPAVDGYMHEPKLDGWRFCAEATDGRVRLWSRGGHDWAPKLPELNSLTGLGDAVLDGEMIVATPDGRADFELLTTRLNRRPGDPTPGPPVTLYVYPLGRGGERARSKGGGADEPRVPPWGNRTRSVRINPEVALHLVALPLTFTHHEGNVPPPCSGRPMTRKPLPLPVSSSRVLGGESAVIGDRTPSHNHRAFMTTNTWCGLSRRSRLCPLAGLSLGSSDGLRISPKAGRHRSRRPQTSTKDPRRSHSDKRRGRCRSKGPKGQLTSFQWFTSRAGESVPSTPDGALCTSSCNGRHQL
jgi:hypothetical protein